MKRERKSFRDLPLASHRLRCLIVRRTNRPVITTSPELHPYFSGVQGGKVLRTSGEKGKGIGVASREDSTHRHSNSEPDAVQISSNFSAMHGRKIRGANAKFEMQGGCRVQGDYTSGALECFSVGRNEDNYACLATGPTPLECISNNELSSIISGEGRKFRLRSRGRGAPPLELFVPKATPSQKMSSEANMKAASTQSIFPLF